MLLSSLKPMPSVKSVSLLRLMWSKYGLVQPPLFPYTPQPQRFLSVLPTQVPSLL